MKRDMDLAREIMLRIEENDADSPFRFEFEGYSSKDVHYHIELLNEAGLIVATDLSSLVESYWDPRRLTWQGHEFLDAARDPGIWSRAQSAAAGVGGVGFQLLMPLLIELGKAKLKAAGLLP